MIKIKNFKVKVLVCLLLLSTVYCLLPTSASAHTSGLWMPGDAIVPCGGNYTDNNGNLITRPECTQCEILHLLKHLIDFILVAAAPILATLFFVIAGFHMMLGGANPGMLSTGKRMFKDTFIGLLIVMLAWLITNTLIKSLADPVAIGGNWWQYTCVSGNSNSNPNPGNVAISNEQVMNRTSNSVVIIWATSIPATSQVHYGPYYGSCNNMVIYTPIDNNPVTSHSVTLSGLGSNMTFCYQVISRESNGYEAVGSIFQFQTLP